MKKIILVLGLSLILVLFGKVYSQSVFPNGITTSNVVMKATMPTIIGIACSDEATNTGSVDGCVVWNSGGWRFWHMDDYAAYVAFTGQDAHGYFDNPDFVTPGTDFNLQTGSPAINTGTTGSGIPTTDFLDNPNVGAKDIGAYEKQ